MARQPLGRGLSALLGEEVHPENPSEVSIDLIEPNSQQPRNRFDDAALDELARSITANGVVQPIVVRRSEGRFQIIAGERRWRAAQRAGLHKVPVVVRDVPDDKLLEIALVENIQREELNPVEEARAYRKLIDSIGLTQEQLSERVGKERTLIATSLRLLKLEDEVLQYLEDGRLSAGHGRALLMISDPRQQKEAARTAAERSLSVRETERLVKRLGSRPHSVDIKGVTRTDANIASAEAKLRRKLSTNVSIVPSRSGKGGRLEIEYYNDQDLDRIYQIIVVGQ